MSEPGLKISFRLDVRRFAAWARKKSDKQVKYAAMRALTRTGFEVRDAERKEILRTFPKRPNTAHGIGKTLRVERFPRKTQVAIGPTAKSKRMQNARKILSDHESGATITRAAVAGKTIATRLVAKGQVAVPVADSLRGGTGRINFGKIRPGMSKKNFTDKTHGAFVYRSKNGKRIIAVRTAKQHPTSIGKGPWGLSRPSRGKYPYTTNLFVLKSSSRLKPTYDFYGVARRVARSEFPKKMEREFRRMARS